MIPRIVTNVMESQPAEITNLLFRSGPKGTRWEIECRVSDSSNTIRVHVEGGKRTGKRPEDAMALSGIVAALEARDDYNRLHELEWDDDGALEVPCHRNDGGKIDVEIDPVSGKLMREKDWLVKSATVH